MNKIYSVSSIAGYVFITALSFWVGSIFFFSAVVAGAVFSTLPPDEAGKLISIIFDKYYSLQYIFGAILLFTSFFFFARDRYSYNSLWFKRLALITAMLIISLYSGIHIRNTAREAKYLMYEYPPPSQIYTQASQEFRTSHRNSVIANGLVFLLGIVILLHVSKKNEI